MASKLSLDEKPLDQEDDPTPPSRTAGPNIEAIIFPNKRVLAKESWVPLLGDVVPLIDGVLEEGQYVKVVGGAAMKAIFGGYKLPFKADIDLAFPTEEMTLKADEIVKNMLGDQPKSTYKSRVAKIGNTEVNYVSSEQMRIHGLDSATRLLEIVETSFTEQDRLNDPQIYEAYIRLKGIQRYLSDPNEDFASTLALFPFETINLKITKNNGELVCTFEDPLNVCFENESLAQVLNHMLTDPTSEYNGFSFTDLNRQSVLTWYIMLHDKLPKETSVDSDDLWYAQAAVARAIKFVSEHDLDISPTHLGQSEWEFMKMYNIEPRDPGVYLELEAYTALYNFATAMGKGELKYTLKTPQEMTEMREELTKKVQSEFARGAYFATPTAFLEAFANFELGNFISPTIAKRFDSYHAAKPFRSQIQLTHMAGRRSWEITDAQPEGLKIGLKLIELSRTRYRLLESHIAQEQNQLGGYLVHENLHPKSMSEIIALMLVSAGIEEDDTGTIEQVVSDWKISGELTGTWQRRADASFDKGVDLGEVKKEMKVWKSIEEEITESYTEFMRHGGRVAEIPEWVEL